MVSRSGARCTTDAGASGHWHRPPMTHPILVAVPGGDGAQNAIDLGVMAARLLDAPLVLAGMDERDA